MFYSSVDVLNQKPSREKGQDIRALPTYTIPEAATYLALSHRTLFSWYEGVEPVLKASGSSGNVHLLSYRDLEEAYRVYLLRAKSGFSLQFLRKSMRNARTLFGTQHPLQRADAIREYLKDLVYDKPARGSRPRTITSLGQKPGQQLVSEVADLFSERIVRDKSIFPWRYAMTDHESRPVSINPNIMSGRLVVNGTRIPVSALWSQKRAGISTSEIAKDYGLDGDTVSQALAHIGNLRQKAA
jgi:uncharacterized protein (DUF433 family)